MSQQEEPECEGPWLGPCFMSNGGELLAVHNGPPWPGLWLEYSVPAKPSRPSSSVKEEMFDAFDRMAEGRRAEARIAAEPPLRVPSKKELNRRRRTREARAHTPQWLLEAEDAQNADLEAMRRDDSET